MIIKNYRNIIDFWIRKNIRFSRGQYNPKNESKIKLFDDLDLESKISAEIKEKEYLEKYCLKEFKNNSTVRNYLENLYIIDLLETSLNLDITQRAIKVLDIGSKNWFYATGEHNFFKYKNFEKEIMLTGLELDAFRLYSNFYSRYDYASYYITNLKNTNYKVEDLLYHQGEYDYITWFLPFVTPKPLLNWGLPLKYFKPKEMLSKAYDLLKPGGSLLIVNQGKNEYLIQKDLLDDLNIYYLDKGLFVGPFITYKQERFVLIIIKSC